jgi:MFS family permease
MPLHRQLLIDVSIIDVTSVPLLFADTVPLLALAVFVSGVAISPTFITAFGLIERRVPESMLTEGLTWVMTGIGIGMALGAFVSGWVVDHFGAQNGFWVSVVAGTATVATIAMGYPLRTAVLTSMALAQIGEFSFVLARGGLVANLMGEEIYQVFVAAAVITMLASPAIAAP